VIYKDIKNRFVDRQYMRSHILSIIFMGFFSKIFGDENTRYLKKVQPLVDEINSLEKEFETFSNEKLKEKTQEFKKRIEKGESLDDLLPEAFALVREASKRTLKQRHYDVQLIGGIVLHQGRIAEMKTGEGKTLAATLPAYLNALTGKGVHIITVNDYLSRRDAVWMGQIYHLLGLTVGCINHDNSFLYDPNYIKEDKEEKELDELRDVQGSFKVVHEFLRPVEKKEAYQADITYGTNNEFGFDYLRDNMVYDISQIVQTKGFNYVIIDEVDSILIDEARTPLIISAPDTESTKLYQTFAKIVPHFKENEDYNVDEKLKAVTITDSGIDKVEKMLGIKNIYDHGGMRYVHHLEQALRAYVLFKRDRDYVVKDGEVIIVDEFTGRLMPGRRWSEGLHQAIEAKEGVMVQKESRTLATITFQNYFRMYKKMSGMTGTAATSAEEFHKVYNLDVVVVPTNKPMIRKDLSDRVYKTEAIKWEALIKEIKERHQKGQPLLVGTVSIEKNELLSAMLKREGIPHNILNAKNHEQEGQIIAQAGKLGQVTVATNMAGRGVDIILGGNPPDPENALKVKELGGLHVIGTERHEARRIDNQLRGRSGRQGDPGSTQFFVSLDDEVIRVFGGEKIKRLMETLNFPEDEPIEHKFISRAIEQAQSKIEGHNFDIRRYVLEFDNVMNKHRETIYRLRREIVENKDNHQLIQDYIEDVINEVVDLHTSGPEWNLKEIEETVKAISNYQFSISDKEFKDKEELKAEVLKFLKNIYEEKKEKIGEEQMKNLEKFVLLRVIDGLWTDHLDTMEHLRDSVNLRAYGQRDPLVEYRIEGHKMFDNLLKTIKFQIANLIFKVGVVEQPKQQAMEESRPSLKTGVQNKAKAGDYKRGHKKVGRNDPCPCGSGKKYKRCHGK